MSEPTGVPERWLPVVGFEGCYEVSDIGRVRSLDREISTVSGKFRRYRGQLRKSTPDKTGHRSMSLCKAGTTVMTTVHRIVLAAFVGPRPPGAHSCHNNGDPADNRLVNLRYDTPSGNMRDQVRHGTHHWSKRTHCPRGHPLKHPNLAAVPAGKGRECLACSRARIIGSRKARRGLPFNFQEEADRHYTKIVDGFEALRQSDRTLCPRGHTLTRPNLVACIAAAGRRECLACSRARAGAQKARRYGHPFDFKVVADRHYAGIMGDARDR